MKYTKERVKELGEGLISWLLDDDKNVFFDRYIVIEKRLNKSTISYLCSKYEFFNEYIETAKEIQRIKLQEGGLFGKFNSRITQLMLSCHHNIKENDAPKNDEVKKKTLHLVIKK